MAITMPANPANPETIFNTVTMARLSLDVAGAADVTLSDLQAQYRRIDLSGALTGSISVIFPLQAGKDWLVVNGTSGAFTVTCKVSGQTGITITQGTRCYVSCGASDIERATAEI